MICDKFKIHCMLASTNGECLSYKCQERTIDKTSYMTTFENSIYNTQIPCIICGEPITLLMGMDKKVCDKCREAVLLMRKQMNIDK